jgi:hypothetical protein
MNGEPGAMTLVEVGKAGDPALRLLASEIDARRDDPLLGGVYLCYGPLSRETPGGTRTSIPR